MKDEPIDLKTRTRDFALSIIHLYSSLPKSTEAQVMGRQVLRSGTSVGAQYREGIRAKSDNDFISKLEGALQELEETRYWMELLEASDILPEAQSKQIIREADQLTAIIITMVLKVKRNRS